MTLDQPASTRRRGAELEATILDAAWAELQDVGYARLTMEGVAARARTGKQVLYRRWPNRARLVTAAMRHRFGPLLVETPDTGTLRGDVLSVLRRMAGRVNHVTPDLLHGVLSEFADLDPAQLDGTTGTMAAIVRQAVARGELRHATLPARVVTLPLDLLRYEALLHRGAVQGATPEALDRLVVEIVDDVFLPLVHALAGPEPRGATSGPAGTPSAADAAR